MTVSQRSSLPPEQCFMFIRQDSSRFLPKREKPSFISTLWPSTNRRPIPGLRAGSRRIQIADHDWPFMTFSSEFRAPSAFHLTQGPSHRSSPSAWTATRWRLPACTGAWCTATPVG